ncbi:protein TRACHEARY ELEMENT DIFFERENTIATION-RELATED 7A-like [Portunus trituberculatus]|uniref:protein TRACHEARY ELEMENT DIFFERENTIATION-RELATED 7A-like n=1 Tax=Portunus trituberculatus TaxID=210409 RepID=UPI001E1CF759|nr:protein TRACHEARY ELEMENT DIFFERENTIATION-RELATED 7A-like [Portunus trituberculatus]
MRTILENPAYRLPVAFEDSPAPPIPSPNTDTLYCPPPDPEAHFPAPDSAVGTPPCSQQVSTPPPHLHSTTQPIFPPLPASPRPHPPRRHPPRAAQEVRRGHSYLVTLRRSWQHPPRPELPPTPFPHAESGGEQHHLTSEGLYIYLKPLSSPIVRCHPLS